MVPHDDRYPTRKMFQHTQPSRAEPMNFAADLKAAEKNGNLLLAALPDHDFARLAPMLEPVQVEVGEVLCEPGEPIRHIYFPHDSLVSLLGVAEGRMTLEVGLVGREGVLGATVALGHELAQVRAVVQRAPAPARA